jgi:hypothetical protein
MRVPLFLYMPNFQALICFVYKLEIMFLVTLSAMLIGVRCALQTRLGQPGNLGISGSGSGVESLLTE